MPPTRRPVTVLAMQVASPDGEELERRRERVLDRVTAAGHADLIVLPELWPTGYFDFDRYEPDAESLDGPTVQALRQAARDSDATLVGGSFVERLGDGGLANTTVVIDPSGEVVHVYRKVHLFGYESREAQLLTAGTEIPVTHTAVGRLGTSTCYDLRFPELFRVLADQDVEIIVVPSAWPAARVEHWRLLVRARALENLSYVVAVNAVGVQHGIELAGTSLVVDPWGEVVAEGDPHREDNMRATLDLDRLEEIRDGFPVLTHRRVATPRAGRAPGG